MDSDQQVGEKYVVVFAKIQASKHDVELCGVYFGGIADDRDGADEIAKHCVETMRGGTIVPKVFAMPHGNSIIDVMFDAADQFERTVAMMKESHEIIMKSRRRK